jgi:sugar-specific transcriptional regulator TrmB
MKVNQYIRQSLTRLGLSDGEADIYLKLLKNPPLSVSDLKVNTCYSLSGLYKIINSLVDKGLVVTSGSLPCVFAPLPLNEIAKKLSNEGRKLERISSKLADIGKLTKVPVETEIFEGNSLIDYYLNLPHKIDDFLWCVGSFDSVIHFFGPEVEKDFIKSRVKRGKHADALVFDKSSRSEDLARRDILEKRETKFIKHGDYPLEFSYLFGDTYLNCYKDSDGKVKFLKVESPDFARARLIQYQTLWNSTV